MEMEKHKIATSVLAFSLIFVSAITPYRPHWVKHDDWEFIINVRAIYPYPESMF
ncbi:MAG: hypothetical protein JW891_15055 [Candidatus Lokiarchaeota archaeon]|nr:hypothetical protein [Candidatus Lokiarchaeota archaeon]